MITIHGDLFGAILASEVVDGDYRLLLRERHPELTIIPEIAFELGWRGETVEQDGQHWYVVPYSAEIDQAIAEAVDTLADLRYSRPGYGQLVLLGENTDDH